MILREWFRPPRQLFAMFIGVTAISAVSLAWLSWQVVRQDRDLAIQRARENRSHAAGLAAAALQRRLSEWEEQLTALVGLPDQDAGERAAEFSQQLPGDSVVLLFQAGAVAAFPEHRLAYYPELPAAAPLPADTFAESDAALLRQKDPARAIERLEDLARSPNSQIRAEALGRLGAVLRQVGRGAEAEPVYAQLAALGAVPAAPPGVPAELVARWGLLGLWEERKDREGLQREASMLFEALHSGRLPITFGVYDDFRKRILSVLGDGAPTVANRNGLTLAEAAMTLWEQEGRATKLRQAVGIEGRSILLVERSSPNRRAALAAGAEMVGAVWLAEGQKAASNDGVRISLTDEEGRAVVGSAPPAPDPGLVSISSAKDLPWTIYAESIDGFADVAASRRRTFVIVGVCAIALLVLGGSYLIGRAVSRELAMARQQSDFVSAVSHEFRTPLTALRQLSEVFVQGRVPSDAVRQQYYEALDRESGRLHRLVEGLLKFGRMEAGAAKYQFATIDTEDFLRKLVAEFSHEADRHGCRVELNANGAGLAVRADREALGCAVWNLLDNAVKYSQEGRAVWMELCPVNGSVAIRVRDEGMGIAPADQRRIFQKFVRGEAARSLGVPGTGIGLAVAHQIVKRHGGDIRLESEPGKGSTFTVLLPAIKEA